MKKVILYGILLLLYRCDLIEYHPYDVRLHGQTGINEKNIARIEESCKGKDTLRFVLMGDSQRWYDETEAFVKALNNRDDVDFVIHGGDISDFGLTKEFLWVRDIMEKLKVPYVALLGNHDILGNGMDVFLKVYGDENFSFRAGNTKFICLNTNALRIRLLAPRARLHLHVQRTAGHGGLPPHDSGHARATLQRRIQQQRGPRLSPPVTGIPGNGVLLARAQSLAAS